MPTKRGGLSMFQSKKLTESPNSIGTNVKPKKRSRLGPRKKSAQIHSRWRNRPRRPATAWPAAGLAAIEDEDATAQSNPSAIAVPVIRYVTPRGDHSVNDRVRVL